VSQAQIGKEKMSMMMKNLSNTNQMNPNQLQRRNERTDLPRQKTIERRNDSRERNPAVTVVNVGDGDKEFVVHSTHYNKGSIEVIDFINDQCDQGLCWNLGTAIKHLSRSPHKGQEAMDLEKALFYIQHKHSRVTSPKETIAILEKLVSGLKNKHSLNH